jgi:hypothetical protein
MAERQQNPNRRARRARWRTLARFGFFGAALGFYVVLIRQLLVERSTRAVAEAAGSASRQPRNPDTAFEPSDWNVMPVTAVYIGVLVLLVISCAAAFLAYPGSMQDVGRKLGINPPGPRLQTDTAADLRRFRAEEARRLNTYYWIDKQKGTVHIPIEQAMRKLVKTGIPGFPKAQP